MKKIMLFLSCFIFVAYTQSQSLLLENFDYPLGTDIFSHGWSIHSGSGHKDSITVTDGLTFPGYIGSGIGGAALLDSNYADQNKKFAKQSTGNIYVSFLINVILAAINEDYFLHLGADPLNSHFGRVFVRKEYTPSYKIAFGIQYTSTTGEKITPSFSNFSYKENTTYLIVLKYVIDGDNSSTSIIVNPTLSSTEPTKGWILDKQGTTTKPYNIGSIALRQVDEVVSPSIIIIIIIDGIHITNTWTNLSNLTEVSNANENNFKVTVLGNKLMIQNAPNETLIDIYNILGSKVLSSDFEKESVDIKNLKRGIYIIRIGKYSQKIIIQNNAHYFC